MKTGGQLPLTFIKSLDTDTGGGGGKGQGKSGAAQAIGYLTGNAEMTLSPTVSKQEIKKTTSSTTLPQCLEDIKDSNKLSEICAWQYESQVYRTAAGQFKSKCEIYATGNCCRLDECHGDRVRIITFKCWNGQRSQSFTERRARFTDVIRREERPTEFSIGEAGDFFRSEDYLLGRTEFAALLQELCQVVKIRTIEQGYAGLLSTLRWIINTFGEHCPVTEDEVLQWVEEVWVEQIRRQHVEKGNAIHCLLRFLGGVLELADEMPLTQVKKFLRISTTTKLPGNKFCLCLYPDPKLPLQTQKGIELEMVREHVLAQGGAIDRPGGGRKPGQGLFVRDHVDDDEENVVVEATNKAQCTHKKCLLFPLSILPDKIIMAFADQTGQQEHYSMFGADAGTPSVLSELEGQQEENIQPHNSTSVGLDSSLHLHLTDNISLIPTPTQAFDIEEIQEEDVSQGEEEETSSCSESTLVTTSSGGGSRQQKSLGRSSRQEDLGLSDVGDPSGSRQQDSEVSKRREQASDIGQQDQTFDENEISVFSLATKRTKMKANKTTTQSIGEKEYFPCPQCKKPLTTASALTRHVKIGKCTPSATFNQGIVVKCPLCPKICQTSGGLVRHTKSAHADNVSLVSKTLPARPKAKVAAGKASGSSAGSAGASAGLAGASAGQDPRVTAVRRLTRASSEVSQ